MKTLGLLILLSANLSFADTQTENLQVLNDLWLVNSQNFPKDYNDQESKQWVQKRDNARIGNPQGRFSLYLDLKIADLKQKIKSKFSDADTRIDIDKNNYDSNNSTGDNPTMFITISRGGTSNKYLVRRQTIEKYVVKEKPNSETEAEINEGSQSLNTTPRRQQEPKNDASK